MPTNNNNLNILISSQFSPQGFTQAINQLRIFGRELANTQKRMDALQKGAKVSTDTMNSHQASLRRLGNGYNDYLNNIKKATEATRNFNAGLSTGYGNFLSNINHINNSISQMGANMGNVQSRGTSAFSSISAGISGTVGYMKSLIQHTISVGDVFGFYIGMIAVQAIYDMTIGMARLKQDAISVFKFVGMSAQEVGSVVDSVSKQTVQMPRVQIPEMLDTFKKIRMSVSMTSDQMKKFTPVIGDIITLFKANGRTARDASMAIEDIASGGSNAARRLNEIGINSKILKKFGYDLKEDAGNVDKLFVAFQRLFSDRGMGGISMKLDTVSDAWDYLTELISYSGMQVGEYFLPAIQSVLTVLAQIVTITPAPIMGIALAFVGITSAILVALPLLAAFAASVSTLDFMLLPLGKRLKGFSLDIRGFKKLGDDDLIDLDKQVKDTGKTPKELGYKRVRTGTDSQGNKTYDYYQRTEKSTNKLTNSQNKLDKSNKKVNSSTSRFNKTLSGSSKGLSKVGRGIGGVIGGLSAFLLTNPIGILLDIVMVLILLIDLTGSWGEVSAVLGDIWNGLIYILGDTSKEIGSVVDGIGDYIKAGYNSIKAWSGWKQVKEDVGAVIKTLKDILGIKMENGQWTMFGYTWHEITGGIGDAFNLLWKFAHTPIGKLTFEILALSNPLTMVYVLLYKVWEAVNKVKDTWNWWLTQNEGLNAMNDLKLALADFNTAWGDFVSVLTWAWETCQPAFEGFTNAFKTLTTTFSDDNGFASAGSAVADTVGLFNKGMDDGTGKVGLFTLLVKFLILAIQFLTLVLQIARPILSIVAVVVSTLAYWFSIVAQAIADTVGFVSIAGKKFGWLGTILGIVSAPLMFVANLIYRIVCAIIGCSPGLIPAIIQMVAIARWGFNALDSIVRQATGMSLMDIIRFVVQVVIWFSSLPSKIRGAISAIPGIISGKIRDAYYGAVSYVNKFYQLGKLIKDKIVNSIKSAFGIHSPSKVMGGLGEDMGAGLIVGINSFVNTKAGSIASVIKDELFGKLESILNYFKGWGYKFYYGVGQTVSSAIATLSGNCYDAANAFIAMAKGAGIAAQMYRTFVNGIPHRIVNLPGLGWVDPSGILGTGLHSGTAPGAPAGADITIYQNNPVVREEPDINRLSKDIGRKVFRAVNG